MKIQYDATSSIIVQHRASVAFTGVAHTDRAQATLGPLKLRARRPGTEVNSYIVRLAADTPRVELLTPTNELLLNAYAFNWTQGAIASAINSKFAAYVRASAPAPGAGMAGGVAAVLVGGLDPEIIGAQYKYPTVASPGLFHFDQPQCYVVTQVEGMFTGLTPTPTEVFVDVINLDEGLEPIVDEWAPIYCSQLDSANPGFTVTDVKCQLHTFRALRVRMAAPGVVRVQVRREAPQPMI